MHAKGPWTARLEEQAQERRIAQLTALPGDEAAANPTKEAATSGEGES